MILVAGLVIAALAGIAVAFYYSVRPGRSRGGAGARPDRAGPPRSAGSRGRNSPASSSRTVRPPSSAGSAGSASSRTAGRARPEPAPGYAEDNPMAWPAGAGAMTGPGEDPALLVADRTTHRETSTGARRRVAWRKGTDVDQELWPTETFGGVSDEEFWDDLAADRPLSTTARTAQAHSGGGTQPARTYPGPRPTVADRIAVESAVQAAMQSAARSGQAAATPSPMTTQAYPARTQPSATATQPVRAAHQPAESRGRRSATARGVGPDEDPLTSPAYSLRAKGAVDGRSYQSSDRYRADPLGPGGYSAGSSNPAGTTSAPAYQPDPGSAGRYGGTADYPHRGQSARSAQSTSPPQYGDRSGYRNPVSPADDLTGATGNRGRGGPAGSGEGYWGSPPAYPPVNGYRDPYDPRGNGYR